MPDTMTEARYLSISEISTLINRALERAFPTTYFEGELAEVKHHSSGHLYFTIKDSESQLSAVMWRSSVGTLGFQPKIGDTVRCTGRPNYYGKFGRFQMVVSSMEQGGEGLLRKKFLELKAKMEKEGLFDPARKRTLPFLPKAIGIVTSREGAVIHDIMVRIRERMPNLIVYLYDVPVQGPGASEKIAEGVRAFNDHGQVEVIIVARGGGSLQDLWAFNEEPVVRAIFASRIPVISGVGHEVDVTLADLVADVRAPTPTAAAEIVVPKRSDLIRQIEEFERRLSDTDRWFQPLIQAVDECEGRMARRMSGIFEEARLSLSGAQSKLKAIHPVQLLRVCSERVDGLTRRLSSGLSANFMTGAHELSRIEGRLTRAFPIQRINLLTEKLSRSKEKLAWALAQTLERSNATLKRLSQNLESVSPKRVLERGYSIVEIQGRIVRSSTELKVKDQLRVSFAEGAVNAIVESKVK